MEVSIVGDLPTHPAVSRWISDVTPEARFAQARWVRQGREFADQTGPSKSILYNKCSKQLFPWLDGCSEALAPRSDIPKNVIHVAVTRALFGPCSGCSHSKRFDNFPPSVMTGWRCSEGVQTCSDFAFNIIVCMYNFPYRGRNSTAVQSSSSRYEVILLKVTCMPDSLLPSYSS